MAGAQDDAELEGALYRRSHAAQWPEVDWAAVEQALSGRGVRPWTAAAVARGVAP